VIDGLLIKDPAHRLDADGTRTMLERVLRDQPAGVTVPLPRRPPDEAVPLAPAVDSGPPADTPTTVNAPEPPTEDPAAPPRPARSRRSALLAGLLVLVLAAVAAVLVPMLSGGGQEQATGPTTPSARPTTAAPSSRPTTANPTTANPTTANPTTASRTTAAPTRSTVSSPAPATGSRVTPPSGFTRYTDPRDRFSVVVPSGWRPIRRDTRVDFDDPASSRFLRIDTSDRPLPDPYQNWIDYERQFRQGKADYRLIGIRRVADYRPEEGWTTADWEFTLGGTHVLDRNIRVSDARAHAIYWSTPQDRWNSADSRQILLLAEQSFVPAPIG
jgi:eukaryotic-like serine/threonine-protein kinase